jgi:serine/threonine protein kinase
LIGKTLAHYEITGLLGKGGMGEVYRARDTKLGRDVAFKVLPAEMSGDPERLARFDREARTLASLQHANIASIYGFENAGGVRFLVMELVDGDDLSARLQQGALDTEETVSLALQLAQGLAAAHAVGIIHRDL